MTFARVDLGGAWHMDQVIGILRRPGGLVAVVSRRTPEPTEQSSTCHTEYVLLEETPPGLVPDRDALVASWKRLGVVQVPNETVTEDVVRVLSSTIVLAAERPPSLAPLAPALRVARRATAAHPRAFRGTTYKPPTPGAPPTVDYQPYLCSSRGVGMVMSVLAPTWAQGLERLRLGGAELGPLTGSMSPLEIGDIYLAVHHGSLYRRADALPEWFATHFLSSLRGVAWPAMQRIVDLGRAVDLPNDSGLRAVAARLAAFGGAGFVTGWLEHAVHVPTQCRTVLLSQAIANEPKVYDPSLLSAALVDVMNDVIPNDQSVALLGWFLRYAERGVSADFLVAGLELASAGPVDRIVDLEPRPDAYYPAAAAVRLADYLDSNCADGATRGWRTTLWRHCGELPPLAEIIAQDGWRSLPPRDAEQLLWVYLDFVWASDGPEVIDQKVAHAIANLDRVIALVASVAPAYRPKVIEAVASVYRRWNRADALGTAFPHALDLVERLARTPFASHANAMRALVAMIEHADPDTQLCLAAAPDRVFFRLEKACRRRNDADLITDGLEALCVSQCALAVEWLVHETGPFLKVMHLLGGLGAELRAQVVTSFCVTSVTHDDAGVDLARLRTETLAVLAQGIPLSDTSLPAVRHALQVRRQLYANRVAFRKFLRAHLQGDTSYIPRHPLNQQWLRRHARADDSVWTRGMDLAVTLPGTGPVRLSIERDPLEALRLGTYVGSCLGNGGAFVDSAAAVVLDVNKLVVYARNGRGAVIARQLVAISEDDTLVCFHVYPIASGAAVKAAFAEFDRLLASALGIPIHEAGEYEIANLVSHDWWDDGYWQFGEPTESTSEDFDGRPHISATNLTGR